MKSGFTGDPIYEQWLGVVASSIKHAELNLMIRGSEIHKDSYKYPVMSVYECLIKGGSIYGVGALDRKSIQTKFSKIEHLT